MVHEEDALAQIYAHVRSLASLFEVADKTRIHASESIQTHVHDPGTLRI